jgi:hypothetical protein
MPRLKALLIVLAGASGASACGVFGPRGDGCPFIAYDVPPSINVVIRDQAGNPAALGAVVAFGGGGVQVLDSTTSDTLTVTGGRYNTAYGILVSRPFYTAATFNNVSAPGKFDDCGRPENLPPPLTLNATLNLLPTAPLIRSLYLLTSTGSNVLDRDGNDSVKIVPRFDANYTVSHAVIWRVSGDTAAVSFDPSTGVATFRCQPKSGSVTVTATAVADTFITASLGLYAQGHPAYAKDPPCS